MLGIKDLKYTITVTDKTVECPVRGCKEKVIRQRKSFKCVPQYQCPNHKIYISPTTFEYPKETDNLLWTDLIDLKLLEKIKRFKRESRMARDNSEDAVSWNVFRYLQRNNIIDNWLTEISGIHQESKDLIYWSYSQNQNSNWFKLNAARFEFGEEIKRSSEPDIIIETDSSLFFIESKLMASNKTSGDKITLQRRLYNPKKYLLGGNNWFQKIFTSSYENILIDQKYELMRFWLLGTWLASQLNCKFHLVNIVLEEYESDIRQSFMKHVYQDPQRYFLRLTWESIYRFILKNASPNQEKEKILIYFQNKSIGYNQKRELQAAVSL